jgi:hypothetical protein
MQGSLRRAVVCANDGDTVRILKGLQLPELDVENTPIEVNKNITIGVWESVTKINANVNGYVLHIMPNKVVSLLNLELNQTNPSNNAILNGGLLTIKNVELNND